MLEKHWLTILLISVLLVIASNARAETVTNQWVENSPYMFDNGVNGPGVTDVQRTYDSEADVVCYKLSISLTMSCTPNNSDKLRVKYRKYREFIEDRNAREKEAKKYER